MGPTKTRNESACCCLLFRNFGTPSIQPASQPISSHPLYSNQVLNKTNHRLLRKKRKNWRRGYLNVLCSRFGNDRVKFNIAQRKLVQIFAKEKYLYGRCVHECTTESSRVPSFLPTHLKFPKLVWSVGWLVGR